MKLEVGDMVVILPPEDFGVGRHDRAQYGPFWNDRKVDQDDMWYGNTVNMDFYIGKVGRVNSTSYYEGKSTALVSLHEIYGQKGDGWTFNQLHLRKIEDEPTGG